MKNNIFITLKKELRSILRDKRSLVAMLITPLMIPLIVVFFSFLFDDYSEDSDYAIGVNYKLSEEEKNIVNDLDLDIIEYSSVEELEDAYDNQEIYAYIILENNIYKVYSNSEYNSDMIASANATLFLDTYNSYLANEYLTSIGADIDSVYNNITYEVEEIGSGNSLVNTLIVTAFVFAIMSITLTSTNCATDSIAGEKERGTLETLLTFPIKSEEIIIGKYLATVISCIITSIIAIILSVGTLLICVNIFDIYEGITFNFSILNIFLTFIILLSYSLFISGLAIAIASKSKTYKEAQSTLSTLSLICMIPMFLSYLEIKMTPVLSLIPMVSHELLINDIFCGNISLINLAVMFISTIIYIIILVRLIKKLYQSEKILFS